MRGCLTCHSEQGTRTRRGPALSAHSHTACSCKPLCRVGGTGVEWIWTLHWHHGVRVWIGCSYAVLRQVPGDGMGPYLSDPSAPELQIDHGKMGKERIPRVQDPERWGSRTKSSEGQRENADPWVDDGQ